MLKEFVKSVVAKTLVEDYPHLKLPAVLIARVKAVRDRDQPIKTYTLTILDSAGDTDETFPLLPGVLSRSLFESGSTVAVALAYGSLSQPVILQEVLL